jgi:hypothetical protein
MEQLIFRGRPNERDECDQWTLVEDSDDRQDYVVQERVRLDAVLSGRPYVRLIRRMTVGEFMATDQPAAVKARLQAILAQRPPLSGA